MNIANNPQQVKRTVDLAWLAAALVRHHDFAVIDRATAEMIMHGEGGDHSLACTIEQTGPDAFKLYTLKTWRESTAKINADKAASEKRIAAWNKRAEIIDDAKVRLVKALKSESAATKVLREILEEGLHDSTATKLGIHKTQLEAIKI